MKKDEARRKAMRCWRFKLRRTIVPYLEGSLLPGEAKRLEKHLGDCESCRAMFGKLQAGHKLAQRLPDLVLEGAQRIPEFETIMADMGAIVTTRHRWYRAWENRLYALTTPRLVQGLTLLVFVLLALLVVSNRRILFGERKNIASQSSALDFSGFHPLRIPEIQSNTQPYIAMEGYVRDVRVDQEEKTLHFKLVEVPQGSGPFIVCEILSPIPITLPHEGSRVRVYGVARYDAQPGREWHEVNPVLNIAVLKQ
jgi:Putative zinc-finger